MLSSKRVSGRSWEAGKSVAAALRQREQREAGQTMPGSRKTREATMLTARAIEAMKPEEEPYRAPDQRCKGLAVRVAPSGVKTWDLAYRVRGAGKVRRLSLGRVSDLGLEQARERAPRLTSAARQGRDLIADEEQARAAKDREITVQKLVDRYVENFGSKAACAPPRSSRDGCGAPCSQSWPARRQTFIAGTFASFSTPLPNRASSARPDTGGRLSAACSSGRCHRTSSKSTRRRA